MSCSRKPSTRWVRGCRQYLLHKFSMLLLLDSNILLEILRSGDMDDVYDALANWVDDILKEAECKPSGKTITLLVSTGVFRDYRSALGRKHYRVKSASWMTFKKSIHRRKNVGNNTYFAIYKIAVPDSPVQGWQGDKYDKAYFEVLGSALGARKFSDRLVVFASNDRHTCATIKKGFLDKWPEKIRVVSGRKSLESLIMD